MNIVIAVHHFPPKYTGGAELRAYRTARELIRRGHSVKAIAIENIEFGSESIHWEDNVYQEVPVRRLSLGIPPSSYPLSWIYNNPRIGEHVRQWFFTDRPDILHLIGGYLISASVLETAQSMGIPTVVSLTDYWFLCPTTQMFCSDQTLCAVPIDPVQCARCMGEVLFRYRLLHKIAPGLMDNFWRSKKKSVQEVKMRQDYLSQTLNRTKAIISPSQFLGQMFIDAGIEPHRIITSRQGRDFPDLHLDIPAKKMPSSLNIGYLGQISNIKGVHVLFEAAKYIKDLPFVIKVYGDPNFNPKYVDKLQKIAGENPGLKMMGLLHSNGVSQALQELDVVVVPSIWYENSPNVILEAFAHKVPVITSNLGGMAEMVQHDVNGLLFTPGDSKDLAQQIRRLYEEPDLLAKLRAGIKPIKTAAQEMDELEGIYKQVILQPVRGGV